MSRFKLYALLTSVFAAVLLGVFFMGRHSRPTPTDAVVVQPPNVIVTPVAATEITTRDVPILTKDPADAKRVADLIAVNTALNARIDVLTLSRAESTSTGTLAPTVVTNTVTQMVEVPAPFHFSDYRLNVASDGRALTYQLHQAFLLVSSTARHRNGARVVDVALYEVGPGDQRTAVPTTTKAVVVDETANHLLTGFNIQGGALLTSYASTGFPDPKQGFIADVQWLKYGRTNNPADLKWAFASPAILVAPDVTELGVLPVSINLATHVPHQPFTNVWASPYVGLDLLSPGRISRLGVAVTFTW